MNNSVNVIVWAKKINTAQENIISSTVSSFKIFDQCKLGLEELKKNHYDIALIFLDDFKDFALDVLVQVKKENKNIPVIVVSTSELQHVDFLSIGATNCITFEEFNPLVFRILIHNSIKVSELTRQIKDGKIQLKKLENRLSTIIGNTPMILFMLDLRGVFKLGLGKLWEQFKIDKKFVLGQNINDVYQNFPDLLNAFKNSTKGAVQKTVISINDIVFEVILTPVIDSKKEVKEILGLAHDITERAKGEYSLLKAKKMAENTAKIKQEFIANMSHEIRTPMNAIVGFSNLLEETKLDNIQQDYVASIRLSGENLLSLINSILDFSVIESGKIKLDNENFELYQVLNALEKVLFLNFKKKKIDFEFEISEEVPKELLGDSNRLYQVLLNLLGNSVKFTDKGKVSLKVSVLSLKKDNIQLEFLIKDTGIGIPEDMLDKVFESFTQVNPESNRKHGGTGLGLSIVKNIVTQLNGKISLESKLGKGSVFTLVIPFKVIENSSLNEAPLIGNIDYGLALKGLKILLAEDNTMNQKLVIMMLKKFDLKIDLAETGVEALKALKSNFYDLILMDIQMPDMDGIEATKIIRKDFPKDKKNIPIIALTAHAFQEELDKCIEVGMNAHVIKPIEIQDFLNTIVNCVNASKQDLVMDLSYLKDLSGGDHQMLKDIILTYQSEMPEILMELTKGFEKSDAQHLGRMAHKAKSSFKMLGMESANNALVQIEIKAKNNQLSGVNELIGIVQNQFEMAMESLSESVLKN